MLFSVRNLSLPKDASKDNFVGSARTFLNALTLPVLKKYDVVTHPVSERKACTLICFYLHNDYKHI